MKKILMIFAIVVITLYICFLTVKAFFVKLINTVFDAVGFGR